MNAAQDAARRAFAIAAVRLSVLFALVFYGCDALTALRNDWWHLYARWELSIPYWPAAYPVYLSVFAMPFLVLAMVREAAEVRRWERAMAKAVGIAGLIFLALPTELGYAPANADAWHSLARFTQTVAGEFNLVPSLHVALSWVTLRVVWPRSSHRQRVLLLSWFPLLIGSVLVTHQHHVADVLSGLAVGWVSLAKRQVPVPTN